MHLHLCMHACAQPWVQGGEPTSVYATRQDNASAMPTHPRVIEHGEQLVSGGSGCRSGAPAHTAPTAQRQPRLQPQQDSSPARACRAPACPPRTLRIGVCALARAWAHWHGHTHVPMPMRSACSVRRRRLLTGRACTRARTTVARGPSSWATKTGRSWGRAQSGCARGWRARVGGGARDGCTARCRAEQQRTLLQRTKSNATWSCTQAHACTVGIHAWRYTIGVIPCIP